ncbi:hypothetical protein PCASD_14994 [Puccinia coronata f. sp. avenae]|uniref:Uncharacterized protein n=1 Tax=Puccinia coronata f. sp. avenae TaxID=200324 RepID=A0A2N5SUD1_9BASI|nr:hypothetical protein PCASD_14994 [Puccinia coronata f. sp. avenae]
MNHRPQLRIDIRASQNPAQPNRRAWFRSLLVAGAWTILLSSCLKFYKNTFQFCDFEQNNVKSCENRALAHLHDGPQLFANDIISVGGLDESTPLVKRTPQSPVGGVGGPLPIPGDSGGVNPNTNGIVSYWKKKH